MKDEIGVPLSVGDYVICVQKDYRNMVLGRIVSISAKMVTVVYQTHNGPQWYRTSDVVHVNEDELGPQHSELVTCLNQIYDDYTEEN